MSDLEPLLESLRALPKRERRPAALLASAVFAEAVAAAAALGDDALLELADGPDEIGAAVALEALREREPDPAPLLARLATTRGRRAVFLLRALESHRADVLTAALAAPGPPWRGAALEALRGFRDEAVDVDAIEDARVDAALALARSLALDLPALERRAAQLRVTRELAPIGRVLTEAPALFADAAFSREVDALAAAIEAGRPLLVVGERGSGRRTRLCAAAAQLGWPVFEAGAAEVNAGMTYVGELEARVRRLVQTLGGAQVLWIAPGFEQLLHAGTYRENPHGALDLLLAGMAGARVPVAGIADPAAYERLVRARPAVRDAFDVVRVEAMDEARTLALAAQAAPETEADVLREALALGRHFLGDGALPGSLLSLLQAAQRRADGALTLPDVLATISERSGLPAALLDDRSRLDVDALRAYFGARVSGQPEAVECVVERIALLKAGLTDPTRPHAVLLFAGPTGTGKTEIAKALASYLFGSPERMVRIDLSEYQNPGSAARMLGDGSPGDASLIARIRRQPFSVVLLDEFEKAEPGVFDLFLQVFDDGRLTDPHGEPADFRHAVIILTSNLGARVVTGGVGFSPASGFAASSVSAAVAKAFRPEFLNRLDRTVVFRPLSRPVMREILAAELEAVLARRGLRGRQWAVEFDDSALEFLLAAGFTPDLGARPLKRAVEQHFLTPLALAIAAHDYPRGDQFLFVSAGDDRLDVTFVDPDATDEPIPILTGAPATLRALAREGSGSLEALDAAFAEVSARVSAASWQTVKAALLARMGEPGFWDLEERFDVLGEVELRDRIEAGLRSARSLLGRIRSARRAPADLVRRAAQRLLLLEEALDALEAGEPADAVLRVEGDASFAPRVVEMYRAWARARGMRLSDEEESRGRRYRWSASVTGFAALRTLRPEAGLHVLEVPDDRGGYDRVRVRVTVAPEEPGLPRARIVRRYRELPAPLVRDAVRGWRSGRLDVVLAGDFDLIE
ncbi:MAG TPA: AAA family ATPase [Solirubrobacter sp.]|nr:AAA family ATPase [Solirubrobacter sp.]